MVQNFILSFFLINDWLILTAYQPVEGYFISWRNEFACTELLYFHFLCSFYCFFLLGLYNITYSNVKRIISKTGPVYDTKVGPYLVLPVQERVDLGLMVLCRKMYRCLHIILTQISSQQAQVLKWIVQLEFTWQEVVNMKWVSQRSHDSWETRAFAK